MKTAILLLLMFLGANVASSQELELKVLDTDFSKGRLVNEQVITVTDVSKLHGHMCDGLVLGFIGLREALYQLFPDSIIDRTNVRIISKSSPCITDIAIYLTGGRYQFNTFFVSDSLPYLYVVQRIDSEKAIGLTVVPGLVPTQIKELGSLALKKELDACGLEELRNLEDAFIVKLMNSAPQELFVLTEINDFTWQTPLTKTYLKTDVLNKNQPKCE